MAERESGEEKAEEKAPRRERKREARWGKARNYDELTSGRQVAARAVDLIEDGLLVLSLGALGLVLLAHLFISMRVSLGFIALHEQLIRGFWFIERMEHGEYGMWPGIIAAFGQDAIFFGVVMLAVMVPFALVRRVIFDDERTVGDVVSATVGSTIGMLVATYLVGAIVGTFIMLIVAGVASGGTPAEGLLAPVTSGILVTDLTFTALVWWDDRASSPRAPQMRWRNLAGAGLAFGFFALLAARPIAAHVDLGVHDAGMRLFFEGDYMEHDGDLIVKEVVDSRDEVDFDEGEWTNPGVVFAYGPGQPFLMSRTSFYRSPFSETWFEGGATHVSYTLAPWTEAPKRNEKLVKLKPDAGKGFYDQFELVTPEGVFTGGTAVSARKRSVSPGVSWGLFVKSGLYVLVQGAEARLLEVAKPPVVVARWKGESEIEEVTIASQYAYGLTVLVDGEARWTVAKNLVGIGAAMVRRPKLLVGDEATLELTIYRAEPADEAEVAAAMREMSAAF